MTNEMHQALAAEDLYRRGWKFDVEREVWVKNGERGLEKWDLGMWCVVSTEESHGHFLSRD
jgi:hypothetical protein